MPIQFRTVLVQNDPDNPTDRIVQEPDGSLSHDALFPDKPYKPTALREQDVSDVRALLYSEKATETERQAAIPVARDLAAGKTPAPSDIRAIQDAKAAADAG